jgi:hypothetical protein
MQGAVDGVPAAVFAPAQDTWVSVFRVQWRCVVLAVICCTQLNATELLLGHDQSNM